VTQWTQQHSHDLHHSENLFNSNLFQTYFLKFSPFFSSHHIFLLPKPHSFSHTFNFRLTLSPTQTSFSRWDCRHGRTWFTPKIRGRVAGNSFPWSVSHSQAKGHRVRTIMSSLFYRLSFSNVEIESNN